MSCCNTGARVPAISVTLKEYPSGCQCIPAPTPTPPPPPGSSGGSTEASKLETPRQISLSGAATGFTYFDGSADVDIAVTIPAITNIELEELLK